MRNRRLISILLSVSMVFSMCITPAFAGVMEDKEAVYIEEDDGKPSSPSNALSGNVWQRMCFSGKQATVLYDRTGKAYAVKGSKINVGSGAESGDKKAFKINKKGIAKAGKGGPTTITSAVYGTEYVEIITPKMTEKKVTMSVGDTHQLTLTDASGDLMARGIPVAWESSNQNVIQVVSGNCYGVGIGTARVTAYAGGKGYRATVKVSDKASSTIVVNAPTGKKTKIKGIKGANKLSYTVSGEGAAIDKGKITAGTVTVSGINASMSDGHKILIYPESAQVSCDTINLKIGERIPVIIKDCHEYPLWRSKNLAVATISEYGIAIGQGAGETVIRTKAAGKKFKIKVKVSNEIYNPAGENRTLTEKKWIIDRVNGNRGYWLYIYSNGDTEIREDGEESGEKSGGEGQGDEYYMPDIDVNGGEEDISDLTDPYPLTMDVTQFILRSPTRRGYEFLGWTGSNGDTPEKDPVIVIAGRSPEEIRNLHFIANWQLIEYRIAYTLDGGTAEGNPMHYTVESGDITLNDPVRKGYGFLGWTGSNGNAPEREVRIPKGSIGEREYKANWKALGYSISIDPDGAEEREEDLLDPFPVTSDVKRFFIKNPTRTGYEFLGWTGSNGDTPEKNLWVDISGMTREEIEALTYKANWKPVEYDITYNLYGGTMNGGATKYTIESDDIELPEPTKTGYRFKGWTGANGYTPQRAVTIQHGKTGNLTFNANWEIETYTIAYDLKGGTNDAGNPRNYNITTDTITLKDPSKADYDFTGWTGSNGSAPEKGVTIPKGSHGDRSYTANWTPTVYTITYNLDGGTMTGGTNTYTVESDDIELPVPVKDGYRFTGWTGANGYAPQRSVTIQHGKTGNLTFNANWEIETYTITYDLDGGTNSALNPGSYKITSDSITLNDPTRAGYDFDGWTGSNGTIPQRSVTIPKGSTGDREYTANWTARTDTAYTVKHFKMGLDGTYPSTPSDTDYLTGTTGTTVDAALKSYEGFTAPDLQQVTILGNGSASVSYRYIRNKYTVTFTGAAHATLKDNSNTRPRLLYYGAQIGTLPTASDLNIDEGYELTGWETAD